MYTYDDGDYIYSGGEEKLDSVLEVESILEDKISCMKENEPYAKLSIERLEKALGVIKDIWFDLDR